MAIVLPHNQQLLQLLHLTCRNMLTLGRQENAYQQFTHTILVRNWHNWHIFSQPTLGKLLSRSKQRHDLVYRESQSKLTQAMCHLSGIALTPILVTIANYQNDLGLLTRSLNNRHCQISRPLWKR
jgi:hypothetical protein